MVRLQKRPLRINALLKSIYTDLRHPASFSSPYTLFRATKQKNPNILYKDVQSWLETQPVYTKYRRIKVKHPHCKVLSRGLRYQYQADLVNYSALRRDNHSFTFLLTIIDIFSRFALAIPIKSKKSPHVAAVLEKAFKVMKPPRKLQTDMGNEFYNSHIKRVLNRYRVHHFSTDQPLKAQIVERFNRTLREMLKQSMTYRKSLDYISLLSDFLYGYNARPHTAYLPFAPREVNKNNEAQVHELQYGEYLRQQKAKHKYSIGYHVRKAINKEAFSKSYKFKNFSEKLYEIIDTVHTRPPMYHLKDLRTGNVLDGAVYQEQIQRVRDDT